MRRVGSYAIGQVAVAAINATASWIMMTIVGIPYAAVLAVAVGFLGLIPMVGATLGRGAGLHGRALRRAEEGGHRAHLLRGLPADRELRRRAADHAAHGVGAGRDDRRRRARRRRAARRCSAPCWPSRWRPACCCSTKRCSSRGSAGPEPPARLASRRATRPSRGWLGVGVGVRGVHRAPRCLRCPARPGTPAPCAAAARDPGATTATISSSARRTSVSPTHRCRPPSTPTTRACGTAANRRAASAGAGSRRARAPAPRAACRRRPRPAGARRRLKRSGGLSRIAPSTAGSCPCISARSVPKDQPSSHRCGRSWNSANSIAAATSNRSDRASSKAPPEVPRGDVVPRVLKRRTAMSARAGSR